MNDDQIATPTGSENEPAIDKDSATAGSTLPSQADSSDDNKQPQDDYYDVDYAKKEVLSTIGDGEMHNEGLVGTGEPTADIQTSTERLNDEQDEAEFHDNEG